jgi:predicted solute-binding protein
MKEDKHHLQELKEQLQETKGPKEKVFAVFCHRHGVSIEQCKEYYDQLLASGEVKEK